jgi:hypothetical protein
MMDLSALDRRVAPEAAPDRLGERLRTIDDEQATAPIFVEGNTVGVVLIGVAFLSWNQHPKPTGSRRATPLLLFQHSAQRGNAVEPGLALRSICRMGRSASAWREFW